MNDYVKAWAAIGIMLVGCTNQDLTRVSSEQNLRTADTCMDKGKRPLWVRVPNESRYVVIGCDAKGTYDTGRYSTWTDIDKDQEIVRLGLEKEALNSQLHECITEAARPAPRDDEMFR